MKLGRYTLVGRLGAGAMAEVHAARLEGAGGFSRRVAIKRMRPHLVKHPGVHDMLVTEGRLAAVLEHAAILQVYELLDEGGEFGLVMEYADLGPLQRLLDAAKTSGEPLPWPVVVALGAEVASALAYAHQLTDVRGTPMGVVHRDVSPTNILLTSSGGVKLADFGIAAARGALERGLSGEVAGKAEYMPREEALGLPSTDRVDVFALGAVLYECLTLEKAFPQGHRRARETGAARRPLAEARPDVPPALGALVEQALADEPGARPTAEALASGLRALQAPLPGGLARFFAQHLQPVTPEPEEDPHAAPTPLGTPPVAKPPPRLLGRAADVDALLERFGAGARAVTVVGAPGMGKSTVALHVLVTQAERWPQRWLVPLQDAAPPWGLALALSRALAVPLDTSVAPAAALERLGDVLAARTREVRGLLVLDGAETFAAALRLVAPAWLERAPGLDVLVTSTERAGFGEAVTLGPLPPEAARAVLLARAPPGADVRDAATLRRLVERLEGVPLALELAGAALKDTPLGALEEHLAAGDTLAPGEALREALDSLVARLDEVEQAAFAQLAIFAGGFTLPAAAAVVELPPGAPSLQVVLERLLQRSLVRRLPGPGERYGQYELLRAFGLARLDLQGRRDAVGARHTAWYLREGVRWAAAASGRLARPMGDVLLAELPNLLRVHQRALEALPMTATDAANALVVALVLEPVLSLRGPHGLLLSLLDTALSAATTHPVHPPLKARARLVRGNLLRELGRLADAEVDLDRGLELATELGDLRLELKARGFRATLLTEQARYELAGAELGRAEALAAQLGDRRLLAVCEGQRALVALEQGRLDDALACSTRTLARFAELGDRRLEAVGTGHLATLHLELGHLDEARAGYDAALALLDAARDVRSHALFSGYRALSDALAGHGQQAAQGLRAVVRRLRELGELRFGALFEACLGAVLAMAGELEEAKGHLDAAEGRLQSQGDTIFLEAVAVHRRQLELAAGARGAALEPPSPPPRDNDVRLAWQLLARGQARGA